MSKQKEEKQFVIASGIPVKAIYTSEDVAGIDPSRELGAPGEAPFTRGGYPGMYRTQPWRIRQITGHGTVEDQHERVKYALSLGQTAITVIADQSTASLLDVDHPSVLSRIDDVGLWGAPMSSLRDYEVLLEGIPQDKIYAAVMGTPHFMPFCNGGYFALAENRGIPLNKLSGTCNEDMCTAYLACPYPDMPPPQHGLRLAADLIEFCTENIPHWTTASFSGYNIRETGITAYQEIAIVLANAITFIDEVLSRGKFKIDDFAPGLGASHLSCDRDFFEEIAKFRAVRRMWYRLLTERYQAQKTDSLKFKIHVQTSGAALTYQQPMNNAVRVAYHVLAAALGGVQSMHADGFDEAISAPSELSALLAIRTQQIAQVETNITNVADPLGGSYYIESLTNAVEEQAWDYLKKIEQQGGFVEALNSGWLPRELAKGMLDQEKLAQSGEKKIVGVNCFEMEEEPFKVPAFKTNPSAGEEQLAKLKQIRKERDSRKVKTALDDLRKAAEDGSNIMRPSMTALKAYATAGEMGQVWREVFGTWNKPMWV
ncbi:MAG: methylmalonyl-CoA mutase family protein [Dehalococcoidia bacterium]|nr:methylmalonyl-CoA mutase family protein [Dehalococcoidia bacterium]